MLAYTGTTYPTFMVSVFTQFPTLKKKRYLHGLPALVLPPGYSLPSAEDAPTDLKDVSAVLAAAFPDKDWSIAGTRERLWDDATVALTFLIRDAAGSPAASASVRTLPERHPGSGYVHWVGASPDHQAGDQVVP